MKAKVKTKLIVSRGKGQDIVRFLEYSCFQSQSLEASGDMQAVEACSDDCELHGLGQGNNLTMAVPALDGQCDKSHEFCAGLLGSAFEQMPPLPGKLTPLHPDHFFHQGA